MANKNPFEIRLEVLNMAKDIEMEHYHMNRERLLAQWNIDVDTAIRKGETPPPMPQMPAFPTEEALVKRAQFLSEYIDGAHTPRKKEQLNG